MKKIIIIAVVAVLVCIGTVGAVVAILNSPKQVASRALENLVDELLERDEIEPLTQILNGGSVEFTADSEALNDLLKTKTPYGVSGKIYFAEKALLVDEFTLIAGNKMINADLYCSEDMIYVENSEIMNGVWGLEKGELYHTWSGSVFAPNSGHDFALDKATFDVVGEILKALDEDLDKDMIADLEALSDRYLEKAWKLIAKHAEFESEKDEVRINKERKNARVITITLDDQAVIAIMEDFYEYLSEDEKLADLVEEYGDRLTTVLEEVYEIDDVTAAYEECLAEIGKDVETAVAKVEAQMEHEIIITMVTPTMSAEVLMLNVEYDKADYATIQFGHDGIHKTDCISVNIPGTLEFTYEIKKDNKDEFLAEMKLNGAMLASLEIDRDEETYELKLWDFYTVEGITKSKSGKSTVTVDKLSMGELETYENLGITLVFDKKDEMPEPETEITPIFTAKGDDLEACMKEMREFVSPLLAGALWGS